MTNEIQHYPKALILEKSQNITVGLDDRHTNLRELQARCHYLLCNILQHIHGSSQYPLNIHLEDIGPARFNVTYRPCGQRFDVVHMDDM
jgi:hypothetical protein